MPALKISFSENLLRYICSLESQNLIVEGKSPKGVRGYQCIRQDLIFTVKVLDYKCYTLSMQVP